MVSPKVRSTGIQSRTIGPAPTRPPWYDDLRAEILQYYPGRPDRVLIADDFPGDGQRSPADRFADDILLVAEWAFELLLTAKIALRRQDSMQELKDTKKLLAKLKSRIETMSPEVVSLIPNDFDHCQFVDQISSTMIHLETAIDRAKKLPRKEKTTDDIAVITHELALRTLRTAKDHGMAVSASGNDAFENSYSDAIKLLRVIGAHLGINRELATWRGIVERVKREAGNLD